MYDHRSHTHTRSWCTTFTSSKRFSNIFAKSDLPERVQPDNATMVIEEWKGANAWIVLPKHVFQKSQDSVCLFTFVFAVLDWPKHNFLDTVLPILLRYVIKSEGLIWSISWVHRMQRRTSDICYNQLESVETDAGKQIHERVDKLAARAIQPR